MDLLALSATLVRIRKVPYDFRMRRRGESKLDVRVELEYLYLVLDTLIGHNVPTRFVLFLLVGCFGLSVHLSILACILEDGGATSQSLNMTPLPKIRIGFNSWPSGNVERPLP